MFKLRNVGVLMPYVGIKQRALNSTGVICLAKPVVQDLVQDLDK